MENPDNLAIVVEGNVMLFERCGPLLEFHWLKTVPGLRKLIADTRKAMRSAFEQTGASIIYGLIPDDRRDSKLAARLVGARSTGRYASRFGDVEAFVIAPEILKG